MKPICLTCLNLGKVPAPSSPELVPCIDCLPDDELPVPAESIFRAHGVRVPNIVLRGLVADVAALAV